MLTGVHPFSAREAGPPVRSGVALEDVIAGVWRQRAPMIVAFFLVLAMGLAFATTLKRSYTANSSLIVRLGQEYVYNPQVGDAARGATPEIDSVVQSEVEILASDALKSRVIRRIGLARLYPALGRAYAKADAPKRAQIEGQAIKAMQRAFKVGSAPASAVVKLSFSHTDAKMAAEALNTFISEYQSYRYNVLAERDAGALTVQRQAFEARLAKVNAELQAFLADNGIGDFDSEKASLASLYTALLTERYSLAAQVSEARGRLAATQQAVSSAPPGIDLYQDVDNTTAQKLLALRLERQDLLSRYKADAQPVRDVDQKIAAMQALAAAQPGAGAGARRVGPNPVYQTLQTERNAAQAQSQALASRQQSVAQELEDVNQRRQRLAELEPRYQALVRDRDVLAGNVRSFTVREQESQAAQALAQQAADNVRVVERATVPVKAESLRKPVAMLSVLIAGFAALCLGLALAFLEPGYASRGAVERALDLPVLASAPLKRAS